MIMYIAVEPRTEPISIQMGRLWVPSIVVSYKETSAQIAKAEEARKERGKRTKRQKGPKGNGDEK